MLNSVNITCILAHKAVDSFIVDCDGVFIRCIGADVDAVPLLSFIELSGRLCNLVIRNTAQTVVDVSALAVID